MVFRRCGFFTAAKCRIADTALRDWFRSSFRNPLAPDAGVTSNCTSALADCGAVLCFSPQKAMLFLLALCERAASTRRG
jgi:hypothetical protein